MTSTVQVRIAPELLDELEKRAEEGLSTAWDKRLTPPEVLLLVSSYRERDVLAAQAEMLREALRETIPYVNGVTHSDQPWRVETATGVLARVQEALSVA